MKYLIAFLKQKKGMTALILLSALLQAFGTLLAPYFVAEIIDRGIAEQNVPVIVSIGLQMLFAAGLTAAVSLWGSYLSADLAAQAGRHLRERLFDKTQELSVKEFAQFGTASMITRATGDITVIQQTVILAVQLVLPTPLVAAAAVVMTIAVSPALLYIPLTSMAAFFVVVFLLMRKSAPISKTIQDRVDAINRVVRESISGIRVIRAFDNSEYERARSDGAFCDYASQVIRLNRVFAAFAPLVWMIMGAAMVAAVWFGGRLVLGQTLLVGGISAVTEYTIMTLGYLMMSAMVLAYLPRMTACLERIEQVLDIAPEISDPAGAPEPPRGEDAVQISFRNATFTYKGAEEPVLKNLTFDCPRGATTAIIGGTGSGKSTAAALMLRLYDVESGQIFVEGRDVRSAPQNELRERIGFVPQKAFLFSGTIAENLRLGKPDATMEELERAARIAQADGFIRELEAGYDSPVAQGGTNLSGGQRQRLCIARALVKQAPVYVFDDSFSALDFQTDAALRAALRRELHGAAVVIVAQRISTIMDADRIVVLDGGAVAGIGTHAELLRTCVVYREIAYSQLSRKEVLPS